MVSLIPGNPNGMSLEARDVPIRTGMTVAEAERALIMATLVQVKFNKTHAARLLGVTLKTIYNKLHEYGVDLQSEQ